MEQAIDDRLSSIEQSVSTLVLAHRDALLQLHGIAERLEQAIGMLTPQGTDAPGLDEVLGQILGQLTTLAGNGRHAILVLNRMEQNLPTDIAIAVMEGSGRSDGGAGSGRGNRA